jgi:hypothetical protein
MVTPPYRRAGIILWRRDRKREFLLLANIELSPAVAARFTPD